MNKLENCTSFLFKLHYNKFVGYDKNLNGMKTYKSDIQIFDITKSFQSIEDLEIFAGEFMLKHKGYCLEIDGFIPSHDVNLFKYENEIWLDDIRCNRCEIIDGSEMTNGLCECCHSDLYNR